MYRLSIALFSLFGIVQLYAQPGLRPGGLAGDTLIMVSAGKGHFSRSVADMAIAGVDLKGKELSFRPQLQGHEHFMAVWNYPMNDQKANFFFYDSWVGTQVPMKTSGRKRSLDQDITAQVASNVYHVAMVRKFMVEHEFFIFLYSPVAVAAQVKVPAELLGEVNRVLTYPLKAHEAKFVHLVLPAKEHTEVTWFQEPVARKSIALSSWKFALGKQPGAEKIGFKDAAWEQVQVPHTWNVADQFDYRNYLDSLDNRPLYHRGEGWYRTTFKALPEWKSLHLKLEFGAANSIAEVWLNGVYLGRHVGGYTPFHFGISKHILWGKNNTVTVRVDNRYHKDHPPHTADYNFPGGLYREVYLSLHDPAFVKDLYWRTPMVQADTASWKAFISLKNMEDQSLSGRLVVNLINPLGEITQSHLQLVSLQAQSRAEFETPELKLANPWLWDVEHPHLYKLQATLYSTSGKAHDRSEVPVGFRSYAFSSDSGFMLNGRRLKLKGVNVHQDFLNKSWAVDSSTKRSDFLLIKAMGANSVRLSHYPHHSYVMHLCDSLGILVWAEIPVVNSVGDSAFARQAARTMEELVLRDRSHPSVIVWGVGNEYYRDYFTPEEVEFALHCTRSVAAVCERMDPTRPTIQAQNELVDDRIMKLTEVQGRNRYFGWYSGGAKYLHSTSYTKILDALQIDRREHPEWKLVVSEYGAEGKLGYHVRYPRRFDHSETYQILFHKYYWKVIDSLPYVAGGYIWNMFDFASWAKIGNIPHINQKGTMTYDRKPKSLYYLYQSLWSDVPMVYLYPHTQPTLAVVNNEQVEIEAFSNCPVVQLYVDGKLQGNSRKEGTSHIWQLNLPRGRHTLLAVGRSTIGEIVKDQRILYTYGRTEAEYERKKALQGSDSD